LKCGSCSPPLLTSIADHVTLAVGHVTLAVSHVTLAVGHVTLGVGHVTLAVGHVTLGVGHVTLAVGHVNGHVTVVYFWEGERGGVVGRVDKEWQVYRQLIVLEGLSLTTSDDSLVATTIGNRRLVLHS